MGCLRYLLTIRQEVMQVSKHGCDSLQRIFLALQKLHAIWRLVLVGLVATVFS